MTSLFKFEYLNKWRRILVIKMVLNKISKIETKWRPSTESHIFIIVITLNYCPDSYKQGDIDNDTAFT